MSAKDQARMLIDQLMGSTNDGKLSKFKIFIFAKKKNKKIFAYKNFSIFFF
jgi:hypothetical protein